MKPDISEFSYGYAVTDELIHWRDMNLTAAPVFPSLYQEGREGGGYDVMLRRPGLPLFLQFKLSDCMVSRRAREAQQDLLRVPFYRMHLRPLRHSRQHQMLLQLDRKKQEVYYCAPAFHRPQELDRFYLQHEILDRSLWVRPSFIGDLPDLEDHYLAFQLGGSCVFCSEPYKMEGKVGFEDFSLGIHQTFHERAQTALLPERLAGLASALAHISRERMQISPAWGEDLGTLIEDRRPIEQIAFYAEFVLGCRFFIVHEKASETAGT